MGEFSAAFERMQREIGDRRQTLLAAQRKTAAAFEEHCRDVAEQEGQFEEYRAKTAGLNAQQLEEAAAAVEEVRKLIDAAQCSKQEFEKSAAALERRLFSAAMQQAAAFRPDQTRRFGRQSASAVNPTVLASPPGADPKEAQILDVFFASSPSFAPKAPMGGAEGRWPNAADDGGNRPGAGAPRGASPNLAQTIEREVPPLSPSPVPQPRRASAAPSEATAAAFIGTEGIRTNLRQNAGRVSEEAYLTASRAPKTATIFADKAAEGPRPEAASAFAGRKSTISRDAFESLETLRNASKLAKARAAAPPRPSAPANDFDGIFADL